MTRHEYYESLLAEAKDTNISNERLRLTVQIVNTEIKESIARIVYMKLHGKKDEIEFFEIDNKENANNKNIQ